MLMLLNAILLPVLGLSAVSAKRFDGYNPLLHAARPVPQRRELDPNGTNHVWALMDEYKGDTFFDTFDFWNASDPTNGHVIYVKEDYARANKLIYTNDKGQVVMRGDNSSWLAQGQYRPSVRITSQKVYNSGSLFILDITRAPWGCAVWPAWWLVGDNWPHQGEIDIIEGVHDNQHNQVTWHTDPGCYLTYNADNMTGTPVIMNGKPHLNCDANLDSNAGCGVTEWSQASYGEYFEAQGGGVFALKWDDYGIAAWSFYRPAIPQDIIDGNPTPSNWGKPSAVLLPNQCNLTHYFWNHRMVFDITFCGDWAGNTYASTPSCPGTCDQRLMDPNNFDNATWTINYLNVFRKQQLTLPVRQNGALQATLPAVLALLFTPMTLILSSLVLVL